MNSGPYLSATRDSSSSGCSRVTWCRNSLATLAPPACLLSVRENVNKPLASAKGQSLMQILALNCGSSATEYRLADARENLAKAKGIGARTGEQASRVEFETRQLRTRKEVAVADHAEGLEFLQDAGRPTIPPQSMEVVGAMTQAMDRRVKNFLLTQGGGGRTWRAV